MTYNCTALLVEDNELIGELMMRRLSGLFARSHWAQTREEGLTLWASERPSIIFVDQLLPGIQGDELVREIRRQDPQVPVLGITASSMGTEIEALERAGANRAISKPVSLAALRSFCEMHLSA